MVVTNPDHNIIIMLVVNRAPPVIFHMNKWPFIYFRLVFCVRFHILFGFFDSDVCFLCPSDGNTISTHVLIVNVYDGGRGGFTVAYFYLDTRT